MAGSGLQTERTAPAWFRTSLSFACVGALLLHTSAALSRPVPGALGALALTAGGSGVLTTGARYRRTNAAIRGGRPAGPSPMLLATTATVAATFPLVQLVAVFIRST